MKIPRLKLTNFPKVAVLATGLAVALLAVTVHPVPAQAFPGQQKACVQCHALGGTVTAVPSTATPAAGAA